METRSTDNDDNRKRKNMEEEEDHYLDLDLSLSLGLRSLSFQEQQNNKPPPKKIKTDTIRPPYEWAKDRRCKIHSLKSLLQTNGSCSSSSSSSTIIIKGSVHCNNCNLTIIKPYEDLLRQFRHVVQFVLFRANGFIPWSNEKNSVYYSRCDFCLKEDSCRPMMPNKKRNIDWLFLLLSKLIECCTDGQLRYYCKHNNIRFDKGSSVATASRDRLIQATYWSLCYQLDPDGVIFQSTNLPFSYE